MLELPGDGGNRDTGAGQLGGHEVAWAIETERAPHDGARDQLRDADGV